MWLLRHVRHSPQLLIQSSDFFMPMSCSILFFYGFPTVPAIKSQLASFWVLVGVS